MPQNDKPIKGKIASIVTDKNVFINRGYQDGVTKGMRFSVRLSLGVIQDPDDPANTLDGVAFTKATIKVTTAYKRMSYCAIEGTPELPGPKSLLAAALTTYKYPGVDTMLIKADDWKLCIGDPIQEIIPTDEE